MLRNRTTDAVPRYRADDALERARAFQGQLSPPVPTVPGHRALVVAHGPDPAVTVAAAGLDAGRLGFAGISVVARTSVVGELSGRSPMPSHLLLVDAAVPDLGAVLATLVEVLDRSPRTAAVGAALDTGPDTALGMDLITHGPDRGLPRQVTGPGPEGTAPWPAVAADSACLLVRADLFVRVGGSDPAYTSPTYRDADLCLRFRRLGYEVLISPVPVPVPVPVPEPVEGPHPVPVSVPVEGAAPAADRSRFLRRWGSFAEATIL